MKQNDRMWNLQKQIGKIKETMALEVIETSKKLE